MDSARRNFLKIAGLAAAGLTLKPAGNAFGMGVIVPEPDGAAKFDDALSAKRWAMVVDTRKFTAQTRKAAVAACNKAHNVPEIKNPKHAIKWIWEANFKNAFPDLAGPHVPPQVEREPMLVFCNHCDSPPCVRVCPTKATFKRKDGIVTMDFHRCIGCRYCMAACPYGSRSFNYVDPRLHLGQTSVDFPTRTKGVVEKCNFCAERLARGQMPACVEACRNNELIFGDLADPNSSVNQALRQNFTLVRKPELGTQPQVYYII
ncbi:MAG: 4Fe-4S dicluster domain-containing protein [Desulfatibacillaceae bacterium]|nr:4Fe-4S dicluster domain-containing protein [Desulfatibacillaceae bacterium]